MTGVHKQRPTLGLAMIMKDEVDDLDRIINDYVKYFDKIYVTVTDKKTHTVLAKKIAQDPAAYQNVELSYFRWIDHFGKARNYNLQQVKTDYWMWIDLDDELRGAENLRMVINYMVRNKLNVVRFQYDYVQRAGLSEPETVVWRERIVRTASKLKWRDEAVHETVNIQKDTEQRLLTDVIVKHRKGADQWRESGERNIAILQEEWQRTHRPTTALYIGRYLIQLGDYKAAIEKLLYVTEHGESEDSRFRAWQFLSGCYLQTGQYDAALAVADVCISINPDHPTPWYNKFSVYRRLGMYDSAMQSAEIAMSKQVKGSLSVFSHDPTWYQYRGPFEVAQAYLSLGNIERAYELYSQVKKIAPKYVEDQSVVQGTQLDEVFEQAYKGLKNESSSLTIPKIMHVIWIGDESKRPDEWMKTWRGKHPNWEYKIWGNKEFDSHEWKNRKLIDSYLSVGAYAGVADCMRYQILFEEGGFVHPADSICLKPIDELFTDTRYDAYGVYENEIVRPGMISPLYGSSKGNEFAKMLMDNLPSTPPKTATGLSLAPWLVTGNLYMMKMKEQIKYPKLKVFPSHYFTPMHYTGHVYSGNDNVYAVQQWGSTDSKVYKWPPVAN